jgi:transposase
LFPLPRSGSGKRGRPAKSLVDFLEGVLWVLRTGAPWHDMPKQYPSYQTCHRRFQEWVEAGVMQKILRALWDDLRDRGGIADVEAFIDGTYVPAKKGGTSSADTVLAVHPSSWR